MARRTRKNPSLPSAPPKRRFQGGSVPPAQVSSSLARVRKLSRGLNERDRPFSPERPGSWQGSSRDLVVNGRLRHMDSAGDYTPNAEVHRRMNKNSYELSFSPEFFFAEGEPYDALSDTDRPVSVWAAIEGMRLNNPEEWAELAKEVFGLDKPDYLTPEAVLEKVQETNTCGTLSSPVDVWVDPEGDFRLDVYDEMRDNGRRAQRRKPSFDLKKYGEKMQQWHSGMDAVYAVGSYASDDKVYPDPDTIREAQGMLEGYSRSSKWNARDQREAKLLAQQTGELLGGTSSDPDALDPFTRGYLEACLFSSNDESDDSSGEPLDRNYSIADFAPEAIEMAKRDCARFQQENAYELAGFDETSAGGDFWFTRVGHGVGFWDGDYPEPQATSLTKACKKFGELWPTVGDDGQIYL